MKEKGRFYQRAVAIQRNIKVYFRLSFGETLVRHWWCHTFVCNWEWVLFYNSWSHGHTLSHIEIFLLSSRLFLSNKYSCPADDSQGSSDWLTVTAKHTHTLTQFLKPNQTSGCVLRVSMYHHDHDIVLADKKMSVDPCICVGAEI